MQAEIKQFIQWLRRRNPHVRTWRDYQYDLKKFAEFLHNRAPESITFHDIDHFVSHQISLDLSPSTVNRRLAAITSFYTFLSTDNQELICPVLLHRHYLREPRRLPRPVPEDGLRKFFSVIHDLRDRAMFILMLRCGMRISEIANLLLSGVQVISC